MGNDLSKPPFLDPFPNYADAVKLGEFVHQYDIPTLEQFFHEIQTQSGQVCVMKPIRDRHTPDAMLRWAHYFKILTQLKENSVKKREKNEYARRHPTAFGYMMNKIAYDPNELEPLVEEAEEEERTEATSSDPKDDFTEDEASINSDSDLDEAETDEEEEEEEEEDEEEDEEGEESGEDKKKENDDDSGSEGSKKKSKGKGKAKGAKSDTEADKKNENSNESGESKAAGKDSSKTLAKSKSLKSMGSTKSGSTEGTELFKKSEKAPIPRKKVKTINPSITSPIFFGYSRTTIAEVEAAKEAARIALETKENRAILEARKARESNIEKQEKFIKAQAATRQLKMDELKSKYEANMKGMEETLQINKEDMPDSMFKQYKVQWDQDYQLAQLSFEEEIKGLQEIDAQKSKFEQDTLREYYRVMDALKDVEAQQQPVAGALEEIAKEEINRFIITLEEATETLQKTRGDYFAVRNELESRVSMIETKKTSKEKVQELRTMLNVSETRFREAQKAIEILVAQMKDSEVLLQRALRMKEQENEYLPLYDSLKKGHESDDPKIYPMIRQVDLLVAITAYLKGNFDEKLNFTLKILNQNEKANLYSYDFIVSFLYFFQSSLYKIGLYPEAPNDLYLLNLVRRYFERLELDKSTAYLTDFEFKNFISQVCSNSNLLIQLFSIRVHKNMDFGTYQRNDMSPFALYELNMISSETCAHRLHYQITRYRKVLNPKHKFLVHERAMLCGADDPLKPDYSKLIIVDAKKEKHKLHTEPLVHGHITYSLYKDFQIRSTNAMTIQRIYRSFRDRKFAELSAKYQAFNEAKQQAIREMKAKIVKEFQNRENSTGMGKMKWDAKVRMIQAKLKLQNMSANGAKALVGGGGGAGTSRNDAVMFLLEEAISAVKEEIEKKFLELQQSEDFAGIDFEKIQATRDSRFESGVAEEKKMNTNSAINASDNGGGILGMLGISSKPKVEDSSLVILDATMKEKEEKKADDKDDDKASKAALQALSNEMLAAIVEGSYTKPNPFFNINTNSNSRKLAKLKRRGEYITEKLMRLAMICPEPDPQHLRNRLRSIHNTCTSYKIEALLQEIPSKRLLIKYIKHQLSLAVDNEPLRRELAAHFKFERSSNKLTEIMENIVKSDMESGELLERLKDLQYKTEGGIYERLKEEQKRDLEKLKELVQRKVETNELMNEVLVIKDEYSRSKLNAEKFQTNLKDLIRELANWQERYKKTKLACNESERKLAIAKSLHVEIVDKKQLEFVVEHHERINWMKRLNFALHMPDSTAQLKENKYYEIRAVCKEFLATIESDALIIINEHMLPNYKKSIPACAEYKCHGRSEMTGRGFEGSSIYYSYEAHNVTYLVVEDYHGIFNGSDEFAMKAAGKDRLGSLEYFKAHIEGLHVPLCATFDYSGFRVFCQAKLPTDIVIFNDDGEVRKLSENLVYGTQNNGDNFLNKNKILNNLFKSAALRMNLAGHQVKGAKDIMSNTTYASADIKGYKGEKDLEFYIKDFWRAFPSELPECTPHLTRVPRDQSVFWRQLRPEFMRNYPQSLSPDASSTISFGMKDFNEHISNLTTASKYLVEEVIPEFTDYLSRKEFLLPVSDGLGINVSTDFHSRGINLRHMGLVRSMLWRKLPGKITVYFREACVRSTRDLREEVQVTDSVAVVGKVFTVVPDNPEYSFTHNTIPVNEKYLGDSFTGLDGYSGRVPLIQDTGDMTADILATVEKNEPISVSLLCEMIARTVKNMIRLQLRQYVSRSKITSYQFMLTLICEYFNVFTGSHEKSHEILEESIFEGVRERYGNFAIRPSERSNLHHTIRPATKFLVKRLQAMMGIQLSMSCLAEFYKRPHNFVFVSQDIITISPVLKHNIPIIAFADAMLLTSKANQIEAFSYYQEILAERPPIFFKMSERKGCRELQNLGFLGNLLTVNAYATKSQVKETATITGFVSPGCELELEGPIKYDPFSRAIGFKPASKAYIESKYHPLVVAPKITEPFSVECWVRVTGAADNTRTVIMCGRFAILVARDNNYSFVFMDNMHEVSFKIGPAQMHVWTHIAATYDGVSLRCFFNGIETVCTEIEVLIKIQEETSEEEFQASLAEANEMEESEKRGVRESTMLEAEKYFATREGIGNMKRACQNIMDSQEFQAKGIGKDESNEMAQLKMKKQEAMKQAKNMYVTDKYTENVKVTIEKFKAIRAELQDNRTREIEDGMFRSRRGLRLGSMVTAGTSREGKNFFFGDISCVAIYNRYLPVDRIKAHYFAAVLDLRSDSQRFHAMASAKYEEALSFSVDDVVILKGYAKSLCDYLNAESSTEVNSEGLSKGKMKVVDAIEEFTWRRIPEGIAEILKGLPKEPHYADVVCKGIKAIFLCDKNYFVKKISLTRQDLLDMPRIYCLDQIGSPMDQISCAASIYREVTKDTELRLSFGSVNLGWLSQIKSDELVVALVRHATEDKTLSMVRISDMFGFAFGRRQHVNILDDDVEILTHNIQESKGFDFSNCTKLTNASIRLIAHVETIKIIILDYCNLITDDSLKLLHKFGDQLECLSFQQCQSITDKGLQPLFEKCKNLFTVNLNGIANLTDDSLVTLCRHNTRLRTLHISTTQVTDDGLSVMANFFNKKSLTSLDLSFCRYVTDFGIISVSQSAPSLTYLNVGGVNRMTDLGARAICANCWYLNYLNFDDLYLLLDSSFYFDKVNDGRQTANELMLKSITYLNLSDCVNLTDEGLKGLAQRCRRVQTLVLKGCDKLTNTGIEYLSKNFDEKVPFCDSLKSLDVSFCGSVNIEGLKGLLPACGILEEIKFNGMSSVNDEFIEYISRRCHTLTRLSMQKCIFLTDNALCHFADYLWVEVLDLSNNYRISDLGIEVLCIACNGLLNMNLSNLRNITDTSINAMIRNCKVLHTLNLTGCDRISERAVKRLRAKLPNLEITGFHGDQQPSKNDSKSNSLVKK